MAKSVLAVDVLCKPKSQFCVVTTLAGEGSDVWVNGKFYLFHLEGTSLKEVRTKGDYTDWNQDLVVQDGVLIACGNDGVLRSTDRGVTFKPFKVSEAKDPSFRALALTSDGNVWAGGQLYQGGGIVVTGKAMDTSLVRLKGEIGAVSAMTASARGGVLVGDLNGRMWRAKGDSITSLALDAQRVVLQICELRSSTILVIVGDQDLDQERAVYRSVDGGKRFTEIACKVAAREGVCNLQELPGGPLIAGAYGTLLVSNDDGQTFTKFEKPGSPNHAFSTSCVVDGKLLVGGPFQPLVSISMGAASTTKPAPKPAKKLAKERTSTGYVGSGKFQAALESLFGPLKKRAAAKQPGWLDEQLDLLPAKLAAEVHALYTLFATHKVPPLCGLREGGFCTIPAQFDMDEEGVLEEEWFEDEDDIAFVMHALELFNDQGNPFILIAKDGVYDFYDDPYEYARIADDLTSFLQVLVAVESAKRGKASLADAKKLVASKLHDNGGEDKYPQFILRTLPEEAKPTKEPVKKGKAASAAKNAASKAGGKMFECKEGGASKFWEITVQGSSFTTRFGKIGTPGQSSTKSFASAEEARTESEKLIREKTKKGYKPR